MRASMRNDPFFIEGPAVISFSGGRTSAFMLHKILARGLQPDVHVIFCNTGREDDRTLTFVEECSNLGGGVRIRWLEYRRRYLPKYKSEEVAETARKIREAFGLSFEPANGRKELGYVEVSPVTAARASDPPSTDHPYLNMLAMSGVPNATTRLCTTEMKIRVIKKFMLAQGYESWTNVVGIRADEPVRVARMRKPPPERWENAVPLADAGIVEADVLSFWQNMPFDLGLTHDAELGTYEGNCDFCMLKSEAKKVRLAMERPQALEWWAKIEEVSGSLFRSTMPVHAIRKLAVLRSAGCAVAPLDNTLSDLGDCFCHD